MSPEKIALEVAERLRLRKTTIVAHTVGFNYPFTQKARVYEYANVTPEVVGSFAELLQNVKERRGGSTVSESDQHLGNLFSRLPAPPNGWEYAFPCETHIILPLPQQGSPHWKDMSPWVRALYSEKEEKKK